MVFSYAILIGISFIYYSTGQTDISKAFMIINIYNTDPSLSILLVLIHLFIILFTNCIYIAYSHHQIYILINFVSLLILLFASLIKLFDIYLISFFVPIVYSGAIIIIFLFVITVLDQTEISISDNYKFIPLPLVILMTVYLFNLL